MAYKGTSLFRGKGRGDLTSDDYNWLQTQRRQTTQQYSLGKAQNAFERSTARANYLRQRGNMTRDWRYRFGDFQNAYASRNLLRSGLYRGGYDRFRASRNADLGELFAAYGDKARALGLADQQLGSIYRSGMNDIASAEAARRASVAEELRRARQGL
jgi:hypothetical protein